MPDLITIDEPAPAPPSKDRASAPVVIEVRDVGKTFRIPEQKLDTLKERISHPLRQQTFRTLHALHEVSFDVRRGEFFGIVGRNGSGKSTLLKILASIYRADVGRVRMAGRVAPFIELGVGFNPEVTARENCVLNVVLLGLSRREAKRRIDAILDFGELHDFADLKVKNYSSGMMVRLAFSIMVQADADIMLIDEVLAVGDAAFAQKCMDVFYERRRAGKTVVLVTHDMSAVHSLCHRAMVLHDGVVQHVGDPEAVAMRYYRLNFASDHDAMVDEASAAPAAGLDAVAEGEARQAVRDLNARLLRARLLDADGRPQTNVTQRTPLILDAVFEAARELRTPIFVLQIRNAEGAVLWGASWTLQATAAPGQSMHLRGTIENRLVPGSYTLEAWIRRDRAGGDMAVQGMRLATFVVYGTAPRHGMVSLDTDIVAELEGGA